MATDLSYVQFVMEQMAGAGTISYKRMFGEYGLYCDGTYFGCICDGRTLVKITPAGTALLPDCPRGVPYEGGGEMLLPDVEDREVLTELVRATCAALPAARPRKRRDGAGEAATAGTGKCAAGKIDYKKTEKHLYLPGKPAIVQVPEMGFFAVDGQGDPNTSPAYQEALELLYGMSFTVKMNKAPKDYFEYVVPPLEGLWWTDAPGFDGRAPAGKSAFRWRSMIRQPEFVTEEAFLRAREALAKKKPGLDVSKVRYWRWTEGLCAHLLHVGPYDTEPASIERLEAFAAEQGYAADFSQERRHHEIYLGDPRRCAPEKLRTVIRHPVRKI